MSYLIRLFTVCVLILSFSNSSFACDCDGAATAFSFTQTASDITFSATKGYSGDCGCGYAMVVEIKPMGVPFDGSNTFTGPNSGPLGAAPYPDLTVTNAAVEASVGIFPMYQARVTHSACGGGFPCSFWFDNGSTFSFAPPATIANDDADGDGTPDIADPCDCTDPLNPDPFSFLGPGGGEIFHELVTVTSGAGETWTMDATTIGALDATGAALTLPATMTEISPGVYTLDFYHEINVGYAGDFSNLASSTLSIGNTCTLSCLVVPTLGEWGLIIFTLLLLNTAIFFVVRRRKEVVMG